MFHVKPFCMVSEKVKYQGAIIDVSEVQEQVNFLRPTQRITNNFHIVLTCIIASIV